MYPNLGIGAIGFKASLGESIDLAHKYGFKGIDFSISEAQEVAKAHGVDHLKSLFSSKKVLPGVMGFPVEFRNDEKRWQDDMAALPAQAKLARELGCTRTATWIRPGDNDRNLKENFNFLVDRIAPAAAILADHGISIGLEFIGPKTLRTSYTHRFLYTMDGMLGLAAAIGPNVGLLLDIYHLYTSHGEIEQILELSPAEIVVVHINDAPAGIAVDEQMDLVRELPGASGVLDLPGFLAALDKIAYDGPVTVEPFSKTLKEMNLDKAVATTAQHIHKVWPLSGVKA